MPQLMAHACLCLAHGSFWLSRMHGPALSAFDAFDAFLHHVFLPAFDAFDAWLSRVHGPALSAFFVGISLG